MTKKDLDNEDVKQAAEKLRKNKRKILADAEKMAATLRLREAPHRGR